MIDKIKSKWYQKWQSTAITCELTSVTNRFWLLFVIAVAPLGDAPFSYVLTQALRAKVLGYNFVSVEWEFVWHLYVASNKAVLLSQCNILVRILAIPCSRWWKSSRACFSLLIFEKEFQFHSFPVQYFIIAHEHSTYPTRSLICRLSRVFRQIFHLPIDSNVN